MYKKLFYTTSFVLLTSISAHSTRRVHYKHVRGFRKTGLLVRRSVGVLLSEKTKVVLSLLLFSLESNLCV